MATELFDNAKRNKADEFYTRMPDIEKELRYYKDYFRDKVILCNCDDPYESNFFKYFSMNFNYLGIKKLIATCYAGSPVAGTQLPLFETENSESKTNKLKQAYKIEITKIEDENSDGAFNLTDVEYLLRNNNNIITTLNGNGDFRSEECVELLKEADIVITNPPFSLFREYVAQLIEFDKKFIIIGNTNALTYKEIFKLIKEDKLRTGYTNFNVGMYFYVPEDWDNYHKVEDGRKLVRVSTSCWFTNLYVKKHRDFITLYKKYTPEEFPHYENYDAINVDKVSEIPFDYDGEIGVPITFLDKYNPDQFEIIALGIVGSISFSCEKKMEILRKGKPTGEYTVNAKGTLYRKYNPIKDTKPPAFRDIETGELYSSMYARIIIKRRERHNGN
ncbi:MAG TPA: modification methylase [Anaerolineaceae bacterium]|nr:MAG: Modification methylase EcoRI (Adenine-specificmethyltransferase EcoRI) (M.EcoRI) [Anaerolineae bacterium 49_20]HAE85736.1 modification methylase [Anaerolineaceae bacterium]